ncbi:helix-turn-helix domain-containing protein [Parvularcula marina]|uniref:LuxR family transcriptional regulator n=1 Tax=Parvularcula marina TaxID=2292771 RepID=A0A371RJE8_9PROT|nr:helix-turn-helix transcriptional regulator [Parvularcula marina]RFB05572.1 LuxR family transcriptional regulator [Parvularcula marina]
MLRTAFLYGLILAVAGFVVVWIEASTSFGLIAPQFGLIALAAGFLALGIWAGRRFLPAGPPADDGPNTAAISTLGLSPREIEVLSALAIGQSNKEIARQLDISPNTVKAHVGSLCRKLEVSRRGEAVSAARKLRILV